MGESEASESERLTRVNRALGDFINESYGLKYYLYLLEKEDKKRREQKKLIDLSPLPEGMWFQVARWWGRYKEAWFSLDPIASILTLRWGSSRLWLDESKGTIANFAAQLQFGSYLRPDETQILESAFAEIKEADDQNVVLNEEWVREHNAAIERTTVSGTPTGTVYDKGWQEAEKRIDGRRAELAKKLQAASKKLEGHRHAARFLAVVRNPAWAQDFDARMLRVESRAATLLSVSAVPTDAKPPTPSFSPNPPISVVILDTKTRRAIVNGKEKKLNATQFSVVNALVMSRPPGLTLSGLRNKSSGDARGILTRLRDQDEDWAAAIHMAGAPYCRYRID
jgi:hypothetical protein